MRVARRILRHFSVLCVAALAAMGTTDAHALNFLGITLFEDSQDSDLNAVIADPQLYNAEFEIVGDASVEDTIRNASSLWAGRDDPASGAAGLLATSRGDYRRIVAALYAEGFYGGVVTILVNGREPTTLPPDSRLGDIASVAIRVDTGSQFRFGNLEITNRAPIAAGTNGSVPSEASAGFVSGGIAQSGAIRRAARLAVLDWRQLGHPKAKIADQDIVADHKSNSVDVTLLVEPGQRATIGTVTIEGATDIDAGFITRQAGLTPGRDYDPDDIERAKRRLMDLEVFSTVRIVEAESVNADGTLPITIVVQERKPRRIGVGATLSTTDGLGVEAFWLHRNLLGQAERLRLNAKLAGIGVPINTAQFDYSIGGIFTKPGVLTPDTDLIASASAQRTVLTSYTQTSIEAKLGLSHDISSELRVEGGLEVQRANFNDTLFGNRDFTVFGTYVGVTYDSRDDPNDATEGIYAALSGEAFYEAQFGNPAVLASAEARTYFSPLADDRLVLAGRVKVGLLLGPSIAQTPPDKLFFSGGGGSVRGFSYRSIGVTGPGGTVTGGKFLTEASVEARVKVTENIGIVGFVDAGYVSADTFVGLSQGTRIGVGAGLRYQTGFGPLRLDVAVPLNRQANDPDYAIYVGVGQAY